MGLFLLWWNVCRSPAQNDLILMPDPHARLVFSKLYGIGLMHDLNDCSRVTTDNDIGDTHDMPQHRTQPRATFANLIKLDCEYESSIKTVKKQVKVFWDFPRVSDKHLKIVNWVNHVSPPQLFTALAPQKTDHWSRIFDYFSAHIIFVSLARQHSLKIMQRAAWSCSSYRNRQFTLISAWQLAWI